MNIFQEKIKTLLPAYFALVMATGIVSIASLFSGFGVFATILFYINLVFLGVLTGIFTYRCFAFWDDVVSDFKSYNKGPGFFTIIAALCIVGNQFILFLDNYFLAKAILIFAAIIWLVVGYSFFYTITVTEDKKPLNEGINGTWLVVIVSIQALSTLISLASVDFGNNAPVYLFVALCLFLVGCVFYLYFMSLIIYRISFFSLNAMELGAPYWINMGATAITTLAGSMLILHTSQYNFINEILPFLKGFTLLFWAAGTWWIPLLIALGAWRHLVKKIPVPTSASGYDPTYWAMVFPLGMYTACTYRLSEALSIEFLSSIPEYFIYVAVFAWLAVLVGFLRSLIGLTMAKKRA